MSFFCACGFFKPLIFKETRFRYDTLLSAAIRQLRDRPKLQVLRHDALAAVGKRAGEVAVGGEGAGFGDALSGQRARDRWALQDHRGRGAPGQE